MYTVGSILSEMSLEQLTISLNSRTKALLFCSSDILEGLSGRSSLEGLSLCNKEIKILDNGALVPQLSNFFGRLSQSLIDGAKSIMVFRHGQPMDEIPDGFEEAAPNGIPAGHVMIALKLVKVWPHPEQCLLPRHLWRDRVMTGPEAFGERHLVRHLCHFYADFGEPIDNGIVGYPYDDQTQLHLPSQDGDQLFDPNQISPRWAFFQ
jgi:hypothetical protein